MEKIARKLYEVTKEEIAQIKAQGYCLCPECNKPARCLEVPNKTEFYCESCKVSIPMYQVLRPEPKRVSEFDIG